MLPAMLMSGGTGPEDITVEDSGTAESSGGLITFNFGITPLEGDVVLIAATSLAHEWWEIGDVGGLPTGYTEIVDLTPDAASAQDDYKLHVIYKVLGSTPDTSVTIGSGSYFNGLAAAYYILRGVDTSSPFMNSAVCRRRINVADDAAQSPAITVDGKCLVLSIYSHLAVDGGGGGNPTAGPSGYSNFLTERADSGVWSNIAIATKLVDSSGSETPGTFSHNLTSDNYIGECTLAIRPKNSAPLQRPTCKGHSNPYDATSSNFTIAKPNHTEEGDLLLAFVGHSSGSVTVNTVPTGWTEELSYDAGSSKVFVYSKIAGASEPSSYTWETDISNRITGKIITYTNASIDVVGTMTNTTTPSSITVTDNDSLLLGFFYDESGDARELQPVDCASRFHYSGQHPESTDNMALLEKEVDSGAVTAFELLDGGNPSSGGSVYISLG